jgi:DNA replicative helicase MCM subunit Mcm2 (Cdc46/Mcm family)
MAKLSFRDVVKQQDVNEAIKLMDFSIKSLRLLTGNERTQREERWKQGLDNEMTRVIERAIQIMD